MTTGRTLLIGVLFDTRVHRLLSFKDHDDTRVSGRGMPTFEARLQPKEGGAVVRVLVVHFKATSDGREMRTHQYRGLKKILLGAMASGERVVVMGDFNATEEGDRSDLAALADATGMNWSTEDLACSAFWNRSTDCPTSRLDHVLTWKPGAGATAHGGCKTHGCDSHDQCPIYSARVSDHCPVTVRVE